MITDILDNNHYDIHKDIHVNRYHNKDKRTYTYELRLYSQIELDELEDSYIPNRTIASVLIEEIHRYFNRYENIMLNCQERNCIDKQHIQCRYCGQTIDLEEKND